MKSYSFLQEKELALAEAHGLDRRAVRILSDPRLNYVQMGVLRRGLESGIPLAKVRRAARSRGSEEEMTAIMNAPDKEKKKYGRKIARILAAGTAALAFAGGTAFLIRHLKKDEVILKSSQITLLCGETFQPSRYILSFPERSEVILPETFRAGKPGERIAVYRTDAGDEKVLRIIICDRTAPVLSVKEDVYDPDDCLKGVAGAYDESDGDLRKKVSCRVEDDGIVYSVQDSYGNTAEARIKQPEEFKISGIPEEKGSA